jgi:hypothetical protein
MPNRTYSPNMDPFQSQRQWGRDVYFVETMARNGVFGPTAAVDISIGKRSASIPLPSKRPVSGSSGEKSQQKRARRQ